MSASLELFATQNCWECSACHQKFDALWRPTEKAFKPLRSHMWMTDKPTFKYCPMCGEEFKSEMNEDIEKA